MLKSKSIQRMLNKENAKPFDLIHHLTKTLHMNDAKSFLKLIDKHFPSSHKLKEIFNRNTVKVSYSCTVNMSNIIKGHNKRITQPITIDNQRCNCRNKNKCPLGGKCRTPNVIYKCFVSAPNTQDKVYIGLTENEWKQWYYKHTKSFRNKKYEHNTALSSYVRKIKNETNITPILKWSIVKTTKPYKNTTKRCMLCLQEKLAIITYPNHNDLLNKRTELISKYRHQSKYLLNNYDTKD